MTRSKLGDIVLVPLRDSESMGNEIGLEQKVVVGQIVIKEDALLNIAIYDRVLTYREATENSNMRIYETLAVSDLIFMLPTHRNVVVLDGWVKLFNMPVSENIPYQAHAWEGIVDDVQEFWLLHAQDSFGCWRKAYVEKEPLVLTKEEFDKYYKVLPSWGYFENPGYLNNLVYKYFSDQVNLEDPDDYELYRNIIVNKDYAFDTFHRTLLAPNRMNNIFSQLINKLKQSQQN